MLNGTPINFKLDSDILSGILTLINHFSCIGFLQNKLGSPEPLNAGIGNGIYTMDEDKIVGGSIEASKNNISTDSKIVLGLYNDELIDLLQTSIKGFKDEMAHLAKNLKSCTEHYNKLPSSFSMFEKDAINTLINHLQGQSEILNVQLRLRLRWLDGMRVNLSPEVKLEFKNKHSELVNLHKEFLDDSSVLGEISDRHDQARRFFIILNTYRNKTSKIINMLETISHKNIRETMPDLYKNAQYKQIMNIEVPKSIREVVKEDSYLKSRISEIINVKKK